MNVAVVFGCEGDSVLEADVGDVAVVGHDAVEVVAHAVFLVKAHLIIMS